MKNMTDRDAKIFFGAKRLIEEGYTAAGALRGSYQTVTGNRPIMFKGVNSGGYEIYGRTDDFDSVATKLLHDLERYHNHVRDCNLHFSLISEDVARGADPDFFEDVGYTFPKPQRRRLTA